MTDEPDVDELREKFGGASAGGDRLDAAREEKASGRGELKGSIVDALEEIDAGGRQKTVSLWDGNLAALFAGLEANDDARRDVAQALAAALEEQGTVPDVDLEEPDKSDVMRLALLYALNDAAPEYVEVLREALQERAGATV
jgi:hypothetical protein